MSNINELFFSTNGKEFLKCFADDKNKKPKSALKKAGIAAGLGVAGLGAGALGVDAASDYKANKAIESLDEYRYRRDIGHQAIEDLKDDLNHIKDKYGDSAAINARNRIDDFYTNTNIMDKASDKYEAYKRLGRDLKYYGDRFTEPVTLKDKVLDLIGEYGENDKIGLNNYNQIDFISNRMNFSDLQNNVLKKLLQNM